MMQSMSPNLMVNDVNKTVDYYRDVLGFEFVTSVPDSGQLDWAMMKNGSVEIMFQSVSSLAKDLSVLAGLKPGGAFTLYTRVADVKALHAKVKGRVTIVHDLAKAFYGMEEFTIKDLNGYYLTFATPVQ
ncbi:MAG TPA: VOC family protein [Bacteroidota bacterium]